MKKILFIHSGGGIGGAPVSMINLAANLNKKKYNPLIVFSENGPVEKFSKTLGLKTLVTPIKSIFFYSRHVKFKFSMLFKFIVYFPSSFWNLQRLINLEKPDVIYLNTSVLVTAAYIARLNKIPVIWHIREVPGSFEILRNWHIKQIIGIADKVIATSNYVKKYFGNGDNVVCVHNAINYAKFSTVTFETINETKKAYDIPEKNFIFCNVGTVQYEKGHYSLLKAAKKIALKYDNVSFLIIAGDISDGYQNTLNGKIKTILNIPFSNMSRFKKMIKDENLSSNFIFTGFVQDIHKLINCSDVITFLSQKEEGFGRPIIEGMAAGKPIIATNIGPSSEILGSESGLLIDVGDIDNLIFSMEKLINNKNLYEKLSTAASKRALAFFDEDVMEKNIENIIDSTVF
jgi:glycosyltransferase involved in cell wall biosynthesis